jgi:hypothetical protein
MMSSNALFRLLVNRGPQSVEVLSLPPVANAQDVTDPSDTLTADDGTSLPSMITVAGRLETKGIKTVSGLKEELKLLGIKDAAQWVKSAERQASVLRRDCASKAHQFKNPSERFAALRWYALIRRCLESPSSVGDWLFSRGVVETAQIRQILADTQGLQESQAISDDSLSSESVPLRTDDYFSDLLEREGVASAVQGAVANIRSRCSFSRMIDERIPKNATWWERIAGKKVTYAAPSPSAPTPLQSLREEISRFGYANLDQAESGAQVTLSRILNGCPDHLDENELLLFQNKFEQAMEQQQVVAAYSRYDVHPKKGKKKPVPGEEEKNGNSGSASAPVSYAAPTVRVLGFGDLITVESQLARYEVGEIAHIENVLRGEYRSRSHKLQEETEVVEEQEETSETESKKDMETNERFQLQSEIDRSLQEQMQASGSVTATYLGTVSVTANVSGSYQRNRTEAERTASEMSRSVIERTSERLLQRRRDLNRRRSLRIVTEENVHRLEALTAPYSGVYSWVDKIEKVELRHYATRLLLAFTIAEPGFAIVNRRTLMEQSQPGYDPGPPPNPNYITPKNYRDLAFKYRATDVRPAPPLYKTVEYAWKAEQPTSGYSGIAAKTEVKIPIGYRPYHASASVVGYSDWWANVSCYVAVAGTVIRNGGEVSRADALHEPQGKNLCFPQVTDDGVSILTRIYAYGYAQGSELGGVLVQIRCQRTQEALQQWQLDTYQSLVNAYSLLLSELTDKSRNGTGQFVPAGSNPLTNRADELAELKRAAITAMRKGTAFPPPQDVERQNLVSFFEQCFEWNQSSHILHPYYWAAPERWATILQNDDADPVFTQFLRSGAATLIVPVAADCEERVLHYLTSPDPEGERLIWQLPQEDIEAMTSDDSAIQRFVGNCPACQPIWMEVLLSRKAGIVRGAGSLVVVNGSADVVINGLWTLSPGFDEDRELFIEGVQYRIAHVDAGGKRFTLDRPYVRASNNAARYLLGSVLLGKPWEVRVPTSLIVLGTDPNRGIAGLNTNPDITAYLAGNG